MKLFKRFLATWLAVLVLLAPTGRAAEGDAAFAVSPESAFSLLDSAIRDAKESIELNIYMLTNRNVAQALADRAQQNNIRVTVLMEGEIFGGEMLLPVKRILDDLYLRFDQQSQGRGKFLVMTGKGEKSKRRYTFDHAKYMVVDGKKIFVSSENITGSAFGNKNLSGGTRGWQIYLENAALGAQLQKIFREDSSESFGDVIPYQKAQFKVKDPGSNPLPPREPRTVTLFPMQQGKVKSGSLCVSPKSLNCILDFIRSAKRELSVEFLSLPSVWGLRDGKPRPSPVVEEIVAAAKRGVKVRVLLNDDSSFGDENSSVRPEEKNSATLSYLQRQAAQGNLPIEAAAFNFQALQVNYVHNKGMVADGTRAFVSSINGTENSIMYNREVAVAVDSSDAARFFGDVFNLDWNLSKK